VQSILLVAGKTLLTCAFLLVAGVIYLGFSARKMPKLLSWHRMPKPKDNLTQNDIDFAGYLAAERTFLDSIYNSVQLPASKAYSKYAADNPSSPYREGKNLNASFELLPQGDLAGGILLVHGLTDSPFHVFDVGQWFADNGFYVIGLRLPGHGTVPGVRLNVAWEDWYAAVLFGARMVLNRIDDRTFYVGGFSTGGALTLQYTLDAVLNKAARTPDKLLLLSPAIGVSSLAQVTDWHKLITWLPFFDQFKWLEIVQVQFLYQECRRPDIRTDPGELEAHRSPCQG
jgi:alpha-beta hydrolase superfamily lysophospholipase